MVEAGQAPKKSKVAIFGLTFKEDCPDSRNSKVEDIIKRLNEYGITPIIVDPWANEQDAIREYGVHLTHIEDVENVDCIIVAVAHDIFKKIPLNNIKKLYGKDKEKVLIDVKGIYTIEELKNKVFYIGGCDMIKQIFKIVK